MARPMLCASLIVRSRTLGNTSSRSTRGPILGTRTPLINIQAFSIAFVIAVISLLYIYFTTLLKIVIVTIEPTPYILH